jgi:molybdopterin synthase catalytic subunit
VHSLVTESIDTAAVLAGVAGKNAGACVLFLGTVRRATGDEITTELTYEAHAPLALAQFALLEAEVRQRFPIHEIAMVHRLGTLRVGEIAVAVAVSTIHRKEAFAACEYTMDRLKQIIPIWKQNHDGQGATTWVHPTGS